MNRRVWAASIHLLTAVGAVLALLALRAAHEADWQLMFLWLGVALLVDAVDGPLARLFDVKAVLPRFSGERLDLIVDYMTYVAIPAFVLTEANLLPEPFRLPAAIAILLSGLFHVSDMDSKTDDGYFVGFPAVWNIVLFYLFVLGLSQYAALAAVIGLIVMTFVPVWYVHPFRVVRLRLMTGLMVVIWSATATLAVAQGFPSGLWIKVVLLLAASYFGAIGVGRWLRLA
jgi:phosphatidylcholine synthase